MSYQKLQQWLRPFLRGAKQLKNETVLYYSISKAPKELNRYQHFIRRSVPRDIGKALPMVGFFLIPFIGYLGPIIGFRNPKLFLPRQFWTDKQLHRFMYSDVTMAHLTWLKNNTTCPNAFMKYQFQRRSPAIIEDDQLLRKEGIEKLTAVQLSLACGERCIITNYGDVDHMKVQLKYWLNIDH